MKSYFLKCSLLFFSAFIISCKSENKVNEPDINCVSCYTNNQRPTQAITYKEMASMFTEYDNGQKKVLDAYISNISDGKEKEATISQFFSIEELKQYIAYIEKLSTEKEIKLTGVKIFTAAYPSDYKIKEYRNRLSFILMPTTDIGENKNVAYEPLKSKIGKPVTMQSILHKYASDSTKKVNRATMLTLNLMQDDDESSGLNRGTLNPPHGN